MYQEYVDLYTVCGTLYLSKKVDNNMDLSILGLNKKEEVIYLATLQLGEATATEIAKRAKLKRTTVYNIIPSLCEKGLIQATQKRGVKYFFVEDTRNILRQEESKIEQIKTILPKLQALHNVFPSKPLITLHEGAEGLEYIYNDVFSHTKAGDLIRAYACTGDLFDHVPQNFINKYIDKRLKSKIRVRLIAHKTKFGIELKNRSSELLRETKLMDSSNPEFKGETVIYGGKVAFISYKENFLGVIIESKEIHLMNQTVFDELWDKLD
jgi:sugar-specific transcriptional regulator TrmB